MRTARLLVVVVFLIVGCTALMAQTVVKANLDGAGETPVIATNATGQAVFIVYPEKIEFILTGNSFGTEVQAAHIHLGFPGVAGPIILPLYAKAQGAFTGKVVGTLLPADLVAVKDRGINTWDDARSAIIGGRTYCNIHTTLSGSGEIRGQITRAGEQ
jgi:hypothetical protein